MAPQGPEYNVDWIFSNNSNAHLANHRDGFTNYTDFPSHANNDLTIEGIGDVHLDVKTPNGDSETLVLRDVLYAPTATTNILGGPILKSALVGLQSGGGSVRDQTTGAEYLLDQPHTLWKLWLAGQVKGQTCMDPQGLYYINVCWPEGEKQRWEAQRDREQRHSRGPNGHHDGIDRD